MELGTPIAIGNTAEVYLWNNKVVKVFHNHFPKSEALYEASKQRLVHSYGLNVPEVYEVTELDGKQVIIMEYVKGRTLGDLLMENQHKAEYYLDLSVDIQRSIHRVDATSLEDLTKKLSQQIERAPLLHSKQKTALLKKLHTIESDNKLCHGDFHLFNLICSENKITIIDWVDSARGDIRADVYRTYLLYSDYSSEIASSYLNLYCRKSGILKEEIFQWAPIMAAARLSEGVATEKPERLLKIIKQHV